MADASNADTVTKTMSLSLPEIHRSLKHMHKGLELSSGQQHVRLPHAGMDIDIRMTPLEPLRPTPLMVLPRCRIDISFPPAMTVENRTGFIRDFDNTFRRGGG